MKQTIGDPEVGRRVAIVASAGRTATDLLAREIELEVVADVEVEPAVAIEIEPDRGNAPAVIVETALEIDLAESPVALVVEELIGTQIREIEIDPAIVVVVADCGAAAESLGDDAARLRYIGEA